MTISPTFYEIPTGPSPRTITVPLGPSTYTFRFGYAAAPEGGWFMDIMDSNGSPLLCGAPLLEGADLLGQYAYLGIPGRIWLKPDAGASPLAYDNLGVTWHLLFEPNV